jgi:hypothetical protein
MSQNNVTSGADKKRRIVENVAKSSLPAWERRLPASLLVNIRFVSTLTPEDENAMAPAVLKAIATILDLLPIAYMLRIDTADAQVYQHVRQDAQPSGAMGDAMPQTAPSQMNTQRFDS